MRKAESLPKAVFSLVALALLLSGCVEPAELGALPGDPDAPLPPAAEGTTCRLLVSGVGGVNLTQAFLSGNQCDAPAGSLNASRPTSAWANVTWGAAQPTLGRVRAYLQDTSCDAASPCILAKSTASSSGPLRVEAGPEQVRGHSLDALAVVVVPDGISYQQAFDVAIGLGQAREPGTAAQPLPNL